LDLFDELLPRNRPEHVIALNQLLTVVAHTLASSSVSDDPAVAVSHFNRMARASAKKVTPDLHTYSVIIGCFCRMGRLDHNFATFGQILKMGWIVNAIVFTHLLRALCAIKRTSEAMDIVLRWMPKLGCTPDVFSFSILLKGLCDENKSQEALELLRMMAHNYGSCAHNVVSYNTDGLCKEG
jgi:pentatricopeptide repeat protein